MPGNLWHAVERGGIRSTDEAILRQLIEAHFRYTGSFRAKAILHDWQASRLRFMKVMPSEYQRALIEAHRDAVPVSTGNATA